MSPQRQTLTIATRKSPLAMWQARHVAALIETRHRLAVQLLDLSTEGDRFLQAPLAAIGGKGLFVKEIEQALLDGRADLAVHSLKDMTSAMPQELILGCIPQREDPRDAFVGRKAKTVEALRQGARVGTSSLRRSCQLRERRPDLEIVPLRGNVQTRLRKLEELDLDGAVLAYAGLKRLELEQVVTQVLDPSQSLPAVGQGALAVQCRRDDARVRELLSAFDHPTTLTTVTAERAFLALLEGGCSVPLAGYAELEGDTLTVRGLIGAPDGSRVLRARRQGPAGQPEALGRALATELLEQGGAALLRGHLDSQRVPES